MALALGLVAGASGSTYAVDDWANVALVSTTMGANANRICVGEGYAADNTLGCPTYAPTVTSAGGVSITGNASANQFIGTFVGDGSGIAGVTAATADRIVSGTGNSTSMIAVSATGYITISQSGVNTGWFNPQTGLVTIGVSSTGGISASE